MASITAEHAPVSRARTTRKPLARVADARRPISSFDREDVDHRRTLLGKLPPFAGLDPVVLETLALHSELWRVAQGEFVVRAGDPARHFFAVVFGQVELCLTDGNVGDAAVLALFGPGQTFGEAAMWLDIPFPISARALQDSLVVAIPRQVLEPLVEDHPELARRMLTRISDRFHSLVLSLRNHKQKSGEQRLAGYLLGLANLGSDASRPRVRLPATKGTIASLLSIQPETLSRILRRFQDCRWVTMRGREITVLRPDELKALVDTAAANRH